MLTIKKKSFESKYLEECTQCIDFNEEVGTIKKLLDSSRLDVRHTAVKINEDEIHICLDRDRGRLNQDYDISDGDVINLFILPDSYDFYLPTLSFFSDQEVHKMKNLKDFNIDFFNFPDEVLNKKSCGGGGEGDFVHIQRSEGAIRNLKDNGFLSPYGNRGEGYYKITDKGLQFYREHDEDCKITMQDLQNYFFIRSNMNFKHNEIYFGAPGTGKSYKLNDNKDVLLGDEFKENYERVTFHPDYSYANFVGTYKPVPKEESSISYEYVPGPFMRLIVDAFKKPDELFLLVIEEINRANVAAVFGDIFQLLDRNDKGELQELYVSKYPIHVTNDMKKYLMKELSDVKEQEDMKNYLDNLLGEDCSKLVIPKNMYIWATMNSADQGVFPMDTAFKRRWDFKYFRVYPKDDDEIKNIEVHVNESWGIKNNKIQWNELRNAINDELLGYGINEDKLLGPYFAFNEYDGHMPFDDFKEIFKDKIIMYLFEDAARSKTEKLFDGVNGRNIYSEICDEFDERGIKIFCSNIKNRFEEDNNEE